ncbi:dynein regulatory complex subunit 2 isoform X2 [Dunckerocampus dactyliophorus]|uniref:dynein regulatory complex subunit 2 isoform X2 n=1 Tax=Dunckerocampus dactyliophorus TaxID=161453 RepID=UPI0024074EB3|nr:dynein regulatory complex subunit 2 isoform X2 [Dunckerocampus dactyliophorus]
MIALLHQRSNTGPVTDGQLDRARKMPRKVKKGGRVLEEDEQLLQRRRQVKDQQETGRKREELLTLFLKDKVQREKKNSAVNLVKLNQGWRAVLSHAKSAELRQDITILRQTFERQLDSLDDVIKEAERQSAQVRRRHLQHIGRIRALQDERLVFVRHCWEQSLQHISAGFMAERNNMMGQAERRLACLEDKAFSLELQQEDVMRAVRQVYCDSMAAQQSAQQDRVVALRGADMEKLAEKRHQRQEVVQAAERLMSTTQRLVHVTNMDVKRVWQLQGAVISLRTKLKSFEMEIVSEADDMTAAKVELNIKTGKLRDHLTRARQAARKQLADLALQCSATEKKLQLVIGKGEKVLHAAAMCRKLECASSSSPQGSVGEKLGTAEAEQTEMTFPEVRQLTRRLSGALLQRDVLANHQEELRRDNQQLRLLVRRHLDAMKLSGGALDGSQTLLTVKAMPTTPNPALGAKCHVVIEAVHPPKTLL